jgi:hypothetical protein
MIVDQQNNIIRSESKNQILEFSPPKQNESMRRTSPAKTPRRNQPRRKAVQGFVDGLRTNKSIK